MIYRNSDKEKAQNDNENFIIALKTVLYGATAFVLGLASTFIISWCGWNWIAVPFFGAPIVGLTQLFGAVVCIRLLFFMATEDSKVDNKMSPKEKLEKSLQSVKTTIINILGKTIVAVFIMWLCS